MPKALTPGKIARMLGFSQKKVRDWIDAAISRGSESLAAASSRETCRFDRVH